MPTQPPLDGLPLWLQILVSIAIGVATLAVAFKGYFVKDKPDMQPADKASATVQAAMFQDMGHMRHLADVNIQLMGAVDRLSKALDEHTHHERNSIEIARESCVKLRELTEELKRQGRDARGWDKRDEERR